MLIASRVRPTTLFRVALGLVLLAVALYAGLLVALRDIPLWRQLAGNGLLVVAGLAATAALALAARAAPPEAPRLRWAWSTLALAQLASVLGDLVWAAQDLLVGGLVVPFLPDTFYLAYYPLFVAAILLLPAAPISRQERQRLLLDMGILILAAGLVLWAFWLGPEVDGAYATFGRLAYGLAYPLGDLALFFALVVLLLRQHTLQRPALWLLAGSVLVLLVADLIFGQAYVLGTTTGGGWVGLGWLVSYGLMGLAGMQQMLDSTSTMPADAVPGLTRPLTRSRLGRLVPYAPYAVLGGAYLLLIWGRNHSLTISFSALALSVGGLMALVLIRQMVVLQEGRRQLQAEQRRSEADAVLLEFSRRLLAAADEAAVLNCAVQVSAAALKADLSLLILPDAGGRLQARAGYGCPPEALSSLEFERDEHTQIGRTVVHGRPVVVAADTPADGGLARLGAVAGMSTPMVIDGRVVGAMAVYSRRPREFDEDELRQLTLMANQAAAAIERTRLFEVRRRQLDELTVLHAVATAAAEAVREDDLIERVTRIVGDSLYSSNLGVLLVEPEAGLLRSHPSYLGNSDFVTPLGRGITGHVALTGQPARVDDVDQDPRYLAAEAGIRSELCVPVMAADRVLGVINVESTRLAAFSEADERLLVTIARQLATALEKLRLFERLFHAEQQRAGELEAVRQAGLGLTASLDLQTVLRSILTSTLRLVAAAQEAYIFLYYSEGQGRLVFGAARSRLGTPADDWAPRADEFTYAVARQGEMILVPDRQQHPLFAGNGEVDGAIVALPLKIGPRVVGVMNVTYPVPRVFAESELRVLRSLGDQAAIAIENARLFEAERAAHDQAEALREVAATLNVSLDRERLLQLILDQLSRVVAYDSASIMLFQGERLTIVAHSGFHADSQVTLPHMVGNLPHLTEVLEKRGPVIIGDTQADPRWQSVLGSDYIRCWLGVPLLAQGRSIGLLNLDREEPFCYSEREAELATVFANQAAVAIENARLFEVERRQLRLSRTLQAVGALLTAQMSLQEVFEQIFNLLAQVVDYDSVSVQLRAPDGSLELAAGRGFPDVEAAQEIVRLISERRQAEHWLEQRVLVIADTHNDPHWTPTPGMDYIRSWIGAALVVKGRLVGILTTDSTRPNAYDATTGETVQAFANQAAVAIENARLFEASQRQTRALAGLYNTALATGSVLETDVLLQRLYEQVQQLLSPDTFVVTFYYPDSEELEVVLAVEDGQPADDVVPMGRVPVTQGLSGWVTRSRQSLLVADLQADPLPVPPRHGLRPARTWLGAPLIARDRVIGSVSVQSFRPNAFDTADQRFLESVARQVAIAVENARLYAEVTARVSALSRLYAAAQDLGAKLEPRAVLEQLAKHLTEAVEATSGYVLEVNLSSESTTVLAEYWSDDALPEERVSDLGRSYSLAERPTVARAISRLLVLEMQADDPDLTPVEREELQRYGVKSALVVPIVARGEVLGEAEIWESRQRRAFTVAERRLLQTLCQHAAGVIENARLFEETLQHADEVTTASEVLHLLNATANVADSFPVIASAIKSITGCERVSLAMLDPQQTKVTLVALDQARAELPRGYQLPVAATAAAQDVLAGHIHLTPNLEAEIAYPAERQLYEAGFRSRLNLPLRVGSEVIGSLNLVWRAAAGYMQANLPLLSQLVDAMALAVEKTRLIDETRRRDAILQALAYASGQLLLPGHPDEVMPDLLAQLGQAAGVSRAYIFYNEHQPERALLARLWHAWAAPGHAAFSDNLAWQSLSYVDAGFERWVQILSAGRPLDGLVRDFPASERDLLEQRRVLSLAVVPIISGGEWWGWLGFDDCEQERIWPGAEIEALKSAASALGAFLARQRIETAEREQRALAEALRDTAAVLSSTLDVDEVLDRILADVGHVVPHDSANIMLIEEDGWARVVRNRDVHGRFTEAAMQSLRYLVDDVPNLRYMVETGQPAIIVDTRHYPGWVDREETRWIRSSVGAPIRIKGRVIGFITLDNISSGFYSLAHAERLQAFAHQAGLAIENAQLYASIRQHAEELEQRVLERTRELADANERLKELDRLKDQFISNVSHELRTPLTNIKLHLGLLEKRGPEVLARYLPTLVRETERLRRLIEDLLDLSRLQTQREPLRRDLQPLDDLLSEVLTIHAARAEAKGLLLRHEPGPPELLVPVDRAQMLQVFTNLVGNAVAYTPAGGRAVVSVVPARLGSTPGINIQFFNDGPPIPPEDLPHLFRRFYRGKTAADSGEPGTGLGLSICREIVERHGGQIEVSSGVQGTTFTVWLPLN